MTQVWERLFIGGIGDAGALAESNQLGVTTVIALCRKPVRAKAEGINYLRFPIINARPLPFGRLDAIIDAMWENIRWGTVLLVSHSGTTSAPMIAATWMHVVGCKGIDAALADIRKRYTIEPNLNLLKSVKELL